MATVADPVGARADLLHAETDRIADLERRLEVDRQALANDQLEIGGRACSMWLLAFGLLGAGITGVMMCSRAISPAQLLKGRVLAGIGFGGAVLAVVIVGKAVIAPMEKRLNIGQRESALAAIDQAIRSAKASHAAAVNQFADGARGGLT
jgi:hypothetical protein